MFNKKKYGVSIGEVKVIYDNDINPMLIDIGGDNDNDSSVAVSVLMLRQ